MRRRRKRIRVGRLLRLVVLTVLVVTVMVGAGQSIRQWVKAQSAPESDARGNVTVSTSLEEGEPVPEKEALAAFASGKGLHISEWPKELIELLERNPDAEEFVLNYPLKKNQTFDIDLSEYAVCEAVPLFFQWDERWGYTQYGDNMMGLTGCGPTCLSMVCMYLLHDASYTPRYVADFAEENAYYVNGSGSAWALISEGGETLGLDVTEIPLDENRMMKNLELGNPIICSMGPGDFTTAGHFIVLVGCRDDKFVVNDPNSKTNSERLWSYEEIQGQIKNLWVCRNLQN